MHLLKLRSKELFVFSILILGAADAFAGRYDVSYSVNGCKVDIVGPRGTRWAQDYVALPSFAGGSGASSEPPNMSGVSMTGRGWVRCAGRITATFTWNAMGDPQSVLPPAVIIREEADAHWKGSVGSCSNGLGHVPQIDGAGQKSSGIKYWIKNNPGVQFQIHLSPTADASLSEDGNPDLPVAAGASVSYSASATPIWLKLSGTSLSDDGRGYELDYAEIGQAISGAPRIDDPVIAAATSFVNHQWGVQGETFKRFDVSPDREVGKVVYLDAEDLRQPSLSWCWRAPHVNLVRCNVDVFLGDVDIGAASLERHATVLTPLATLNVNHGHVAYTQTGVRAGGEDESGVVFVGSVATNQEFVHLGLGKWMFVQLAKLDRLSILDGYAWKQEQRFDDFRLDGSWGYEPDVESAWWASGAPDDTFDSPFWTLIGAVAYAIDDRFDMYLMYCPPGAGSQWVSLYKASWGWSSSGARSGAAASWPEPVRGRITAEKAKVCYEQPEWQRRHISGLPVSLVPNRG